MPSKIQLPPCLPNKEDWDNASVLLAAKHPRGDGEHYGLAREACRERQLTEALRDLAAAKEQVERLQRSVNAVAGGTAQGLMLHTKFNNAYEQGRQYGENLHLNRVEELEEQVAQLQAQGTFNDGVKAVIGLMARKPYDDLGFDEIRALKRPQAAQPQEKETQ